VVTTTFMHFPHVTAKETVIMCVCFIFYALDMIAVLNCLTCKAL
jgi:hypothetical protein